MVGPLALCAALAASPAPGAPGGAPSPPAPQRGASSGPVVREAPPGTAGAGYRAGVRASSPVTAGWPAPGSGSWWLGAGPGFSFRIVDSLTGRTFLYTRAGWAYQLGPRFALGVELVPFFHLDNGVAEEPTSGLGLSILPRGYLTRERPWRLGLDGGGGLVRFSDPVPRETGLNTLFTVQTGLFAERLLRPGGALTLGVRLHHLSNANRAVLNPGVNAVHPYLELRFWKAR